jgi:hypothetical protein
MFILSADKSTLTPEQNAARAEEMERALWIGGGVWERGVGWWCGVPEVSFRVSMPLKEALRLAAEFEQEAILDEDKGVYDVVTGKLTMAVFKRVESPNVAEFMEGWSDFPSTGRFGLLLESVEVTA